MENKDSDIFREFKEHSVAEFFKKNRHMLGYSGKVRSLTTAIHELVTNSLDACEEAGILPEIFVSIEKLGNEHYRITVKDNGPGIPPDIAPKVFGKLLAGTKFHRMIQTRGQQGIGAAGVTMLAQMTTGKPVHIRTSTGDGTIWEMDVSIDVKKNEPVVKNKKHYRGDWRGTEVTFELKEVEYNRSKYSVYEYMRRTAIANPHATIILVEPNGNRITYERTVFTPVKIGEEAKPHPLGITTDDLFTLSRISKARTVANMLSSSLHSVGGKVLDSMMKIKGMTKILKKKPQELTWNEAEKITSVFKTIRVLQEEKSLKTIANKPVDKLSEEDRKLLEDVVKHTSVITGSESLEEAQKVIKLLSGVRIRAPRTDILVPIGEENIRKSLKAILKPSFVSVVTRKPKIYSGGIPFQVEVGIAYGGSIEGFELMRFANRVPLLFDAGGCAITEAVKSVDWKRYGVDDLYSSPVVIFVNLVSTHVPYTTAGKQAIADIPEVYNEIRQALMDAGRKLKEYTSRVSRYKELLKKKKILESYLPLLGESLAYLAEEDKEELVAMLKSLVEKKYKEIQKLVALIEGGKA